ncbi:MAG: glycosyltransferase family 2 protein [Bacteroidales bacterium]|nr:glycosyltransferase family 2 protein [Candidatus Liminaster caballi]
MENPLISIVIPAYNAAKYISDAVQSVLDQDYRPIEVIVVDDGSTDNTCEVVERIASPEVSYYYKENGGASSARNYGIERANGEYIRFVDADDLLLPGSLSKQITHSLSLSDKQISIGHYLSYNNEERIPALHSMAAYPPWLALYPKRALMDVGGFDTNMKTSEDLELTINLKAHGYRFVLTDAVVYKYWCGRNPESLYMEATRNKDWSRMRYFFKKHLVDYANFTTFKDYYRFFIIDLYLGGNTSDYKFLRHELPFLVRPTQTCKSRILGYVLWYGAYFVPFDHLRKTLNSICPTGMQNWLHRHRL